MFVFVIMNWTGHRAFVVKRLSKQRVKMLFEYIFRLGRRDTRPFRITINFSIGQNSRDIVVDQHCRESNLDDLGQSNCWNVNVVRASALGFSDHNLQIIWPTEIKTNPYKGMLFVHKLDERVLKNWRALRLWYYECSHMWGLSRAC